MIRRTSAGKNHIALSIKLNGKIETSILSINLDSDGQPIIAEIGVEVEPHYKIIGTYHNIEELLLAFNLTSAKILLPIPPEIGNDLRLHYETDAEKYLNDITAINCYLFYRHELYSKVIFVVKESFNGKNKIEFNINRSNNTLKRTESGVDKEYSQLDDIVKFFINIYGCNRSEPYFI